MKQSSSLPAANGKLAVLLPGMGAVATTLMAGVNLVKKGHSKPFGSLTQLGTLETTKGVLPVREAVPLAKLDDLVFGGWDIFPDSAYEAAEHAEVLNPQHLALVKDELSKIKPMPGVFYPQYVRRLEGRHIKQGRNKADMVSQVREDIRTFMRDNGCSRGVMVWCGSTEIYIEPTAVHQTIASFEKGLLDNDPAISNAQIYAWAAIQERIPFANGAPHLGVDFPAAWDLAKELRVPLAGKDFKTGQTLIKTVIAPALKTRLLGLRGWFSTNILGNRDGEVLDDAESFKSKEVSKLGVLEQILSPKDNPELYGDVHHKVRIEYYKPRGDAKEGWDNIDLFGWLGYDMQLKINFLCRDSILAAPLVLDLALLLDAAGRANLRGTQEWLSFYFKHPMAEAASIHDLFVQKRMLDKQLLEFAGLEPAI